MSRARSMLRPLRTLACFPSGPFCVNKSRLRAPQPTLPLVAGFCSQSQDGKGEDEPSESLEDVALLSHPYFASTSEEEAAHHLGLFVGRASTWRTRGLPWRMYKPGTWGLGREVSATEALSRLTNGEPVDLQRYNPLCFVSSNWAFTSGFLIPRLRKSKKNIMSLPELNHRPFFCSMRIVTVTPDIKALESVATGIAAPGLSKLAQTAKSAKGGNLPRFPRGFCPYSCGISPDFCPDFCHLLPDFACI